jgi:hypothetical protein
MIPGLFDDIDPADIEAAVAARRAELHLLGTAQAHRRQHQVRTRRLANESALADMLPAVIPAGESWHILSTGDVDVLSVTRHLLAGAGFFDSLLMTTWRINRDDLEQIEQWLDTGAIEVFHLIIDQRFSRLAPDEYQLAKRLAEDYGGSVSMCLNHSKVTLASNAATGYWLALESSANVNTNHRLEQTAIHHSRELHDFYAEAFHGIRKRRAASQ